MDRYFKKPSGYIVKYDSSKHDLKSFKDRFKECDEQGNPMKKAKKKEK